MPDPRHEDLLRRVQQEVNRGRHWRAKEILLGNLRARGYDPCLFEQLGLVLMGMKDMVEAGKYLFLSGERKTRYRKAITLFLERYARRDPINVYYAFPGYAQYSRLDAYPRVIQEELASLGLPEQIVGTPEGGTEEGAGERPAPSRLRDAMTCLGCLTALAAVAGILILGVVSLVQMVYHWFAV